MSRLLYSLRGPSTPLDLFRAGLALAAGVLAGGLMTLVVLSLSIDASGRIVALDPGAPAEVIAFAGLFIAVAAVLMVVVGLPVWGLLHALHLRGWLSAAGAGALAAYALLKMLIGEPSDPVDEMVLKAMPLVGGGVGLLMQAIAYGDREAARRQPRP